jgi:flagellar hook-associated protein 2
VYSVNGQNITIGVNESLNQIANDFNSVPAAGVTATVVQVSSGSYKIVFTGDTADLSNNAVPFDLATSSNVTSGTNVLSNVLFTTDQTAQDALFNFNGVAIERASNTISDLATGVTFNLLQDTTSQPGASFSIAVTPNVSNISTAIQKFATDYNAFLDFYAKQTQFDTDTSQPDKNATLYSDTTLRSIFNQLSGYAASVVSGLSSGQSTFADIGINFVDVPATSTDPAVPNALQIDGTTLTNMLTSNLSVVENIFGYNATTSSTNLGVYQQPNDQSISSFTVDVDQVNNVYTVHYTDSHGDPHAISMTKAALGTDSFSLTAPTSSGLAGLVLIYTGTGSQNGMTVTSTNGIASQMSALLNSVLTPQTGAIAVAQNSLSTQNTTTQNQITNINAQIATQRNALLLKFSQLEAAIASANSSLNYLNAQQVANLAGH